MFDMKSSKQILNREFLELRAKLLDIAASLDRIDRAEGEIEDDPRMPLLAEAIVIIAKDAPDRALQIQQLFSREFDPQWKQKFNMSTRN